MTPEDSPHLLDGQRVPLARMSGVEAAPAEGLPQIRARTGAPCHSDGSRQVVVTNRHGSPPDHHQQQQPKRYSGKDGPFFPALLLMGSGT